MTTFSERSYRGEPDIEPLVELINSGEAVDRLDWGTTPDELRAELQNEVLDQERDLRLWTDATERPVAFGQLSIRAGGEVAAANLWYIVRPDLRNGDLADRIVSWSQERLLEYRREHNTPVVLHSGYLEQDRWRAAVLARSGFTPVRVFFIMERPLDQPVAEAVFPAGYSQRHLAGDEDLPAWVELYNLSFIDHWNFHPLSLERRRQWQADPGYQREGDLIVQASDGTFAAFCYCTINRESFERSGRREGWISRLGTRRGYRQLGLGRAMLLTGLHWLKAQGMSVAKLGVDAENPTGALGLYESVGFHVAKTFFMQRKEI